MDALSSEGRSRKVFKPALLLVVLDLLDEGAVDPTRVAPDDRLATEFDALLARAGIRAKPLAVWQPYFHLGTTTGASTPIWTLHDALGAVVAASAARRPSSLPTLRQRVAFASFAPELAAALLTPMDRAQVRALVYEWLEQDPDRDALQLMAAHDRDWPLVERTITQVREATSRPFVLQVPRPLVEVSEHVLRVRDRAFRMAVVPSYDHRCAACSLRLRWGTHFEAEAAHIVPVREDGADDVRNALSLCRTHHWAFDEMLWTVDDARRIVVANAPARSDVDLSALHVLQGRPLAAPTNDVDAAHPDALAHHRERFRSRRSAA